MIKKINLKLVTSLLLFFLSYYNSNSQSLGDYRSINSGNWTTLSIWQYYNGTSWITPTGTNPQGYPSQFNGTNTITIQAGHTVTFLNSYVTTSFPNLLINGTLLLNGTGGSPIFNIKANSVVVTPNLTPAATINFTTKGNLTLPLNATIQTGLLGLSGVCTANQIITIGTTPLATCAGAGQVVLLFSQFMESGGTLNAVPISNSPICASNTINLNGTIIGTPGTGLTYTWTITNPQGVISTVANQNITITNALAGTYTAKLKVSTSYSGTAFSNEETIQVIVNPNPIVTISPNSIICSNTIKPISASGANSFTWTTSIPGTLYSNSQATIPYSGTNLSTIYVKTSQSAIITALGTSNGCSNSNATTITINTPAVWDGIMWSSNPSADRDLIFNSSYSSIGDLVGCSCTVTSGNVIVNSNHDMILERNVTVSGGAITFENNSNLIQLTDIQNIGNVTIKRQSSPLMRLDYTMWSSPVNGQNLANFSPSTLTNRFYEFNPLTNLYAITASTANFTTAKGYLIRMPNNHPTVPTIYNSVFLGVPNNGAYSKSIIDGGSILTRYNAIGNPYPSTIKIDDFINQNLANIEGTLWFWRKTNDDSNPVSYSTCTTAGCTINNGHTYADDNFISIGQGFLVQAKSGAVSVSFSNTMRTNTNVNQFFRSSSAVNTISDRHRIWLELKNNANISFGEKLIVYMPSATLNYDSGKDGLLIGDNPTSLYSVIDSNKLAIQARSTFNPNDTVSLVFKTSVSDNYIISIADMDGLFLNGQDIYLKDNQLAILHDLKSSPYLFSSESGLFPTRFEIVYQTTNLSSTNFEESIIETYTENNQIVVKSQKSNISNIQIFDLSGRNLMNIDDVNSNFKKIELNNSNQVVIIKILTSDKNIYTKKLFN
jgi:trimeric autotransporter adhesin